MSVSYDDFYKAAKSLPEYEGVEDYDIYNDWDASYGAPQRNADTAFDSSVDNAQSMLYRGVQVVGDATGIDAISDFGKEGVKKQELDLKAGGFEPKYPESIRKNYNEGGFTQALAATWEKTQQNAALSGAALVGGGAAILTAPFSAPLATAIMGGTMATTGLMGAGEVAGEMEGKDVEVNNLYALAGGAAIMALERVGLGSVFPKSKLIGLSAGELVEAVAKAGYKDKAKIIAKEIVKRTSGEIVTELPQEGISMGLASAQGGAYSQDEIIDRAIDTIAITSGIASPIATVSTLKDVRGGLTGRKDEEDDLDAKINELKAKQTNVTAEAETIVESVKQTVAEKGGDALEQELAANDIYEAGLDTAVIQANADIDKSADELLGAETKGKPVEQRVQTLRERLEAAKKAAIATEETPISPIKETKDVANWRQRQLDKAQETVAKQAILEQKSVDPSLAPTQEIIEPSATPDAAITVDNTNILPALESSQSVFDKVALENTPSIAEQYKGDYSPLIDTPVISQTPVDELTPEEIKAEINLIGDKDAFINKVDTLNNPDAPVGTIARNMAFLSDEEKSRLHELKLATPSFGEDAIAAKQRNLDRVARRKAAKTAFTPTHELADGTQVTAVEDEINVWADAKGDEYIEDNPSKVEVKKVTTNPAEPQKAEIINDKAIDEAATLEQEPTKRQYHPAIRSLANDLTEGGGIAYTHDENGNIDGKTASINPDWYKDNSFTVRNVKGDDVLHTSPTVKAIKQAVNDYEAGKPLRKSQERILEALSDKLVDEENDSNEEARADDYESVVDETIDSLMEDGILTEDMLLSMSAEEVYASWDEENKGLTYEENEKRAAENTDELTESRSDSRNQKKTARDKGQEESLLTNPTPEELSSRDEADKAAKADKEKADTKAKVDKEAEAGLELTGSDRKADANTKQDDLFSGALTSDKDISVAPKAEQTPQKDYPLIKTVAEVDELNEGDIYRGELKGTIKWLVRSGSPRGLGDGIFNTAAEAEKEVGLNKKRAEYAAKAEKEIAEAEKKEADKKTIADNIDGFLDDAKPMQRGKAIKALNKPIRINGEADTLKSQVKKLLAAGEKTSTREENKVQPMSRRQFNQADQRQQDAHEARIKEAGKKTVYYIGGYDLGKTAYDYAEHLISKKESVNKPTLREKITTTKAEGTPLSSIMIGVDGKAVSAQEIISQIDARLDSLHELKGCIAG